jgi:high-affinity Fe2+/Pb2+ permease
MKVNKKGISIAEYILGLGLIMAILNVSIALMPYEPDTDLQGTFIWITLTILILAAGMYMTIIRLIKHQENLEGKISAIVDELKKSKND